MSYAWFCVTYRLMEATSLRYSSLLEWSSCLWWVQKLELVNGVLFTGGWVKDGLYYNVARDIFKVIFCFTCMYRILFIAPSQYWVIGKKYRTHYRSESSSRILCSLQYNIDGFIGSFKLPCLEYDPAFVSADDIGQKWCWRPFSFTCHLLRIWTS